MNFPVSLLQTLKHQPQFDEEKFLAAQQQGPVISIRLNKNKPTSSFAGNEQVPWCNEGRYLTERPYFTHDPLLHAGAYYVQEASSMFIATILKQIIAKTETVKVLDLCAAPGGKSTLVANAINEKSLLVSNEVIKTRVPPLLENLTKWGNENVIVINADPVQIGKLENQFDVLLIDAPCSGSGLFRKDEKAVHEWSEENVLHCSTRQQRILTDSWSALKPGGFLIYSTCSFSEIENESIADWIGETFSAESVEIKIDSEWNIVQTFSPKNNAACFRFYPDKLKGEGFFVCCFQKKMETEIQQKPFSKKQFDKIWTIKNEVLKNFISEKYDSLSFFEINDAIRAFPTAHLDTLNLIKRNFYIAKAGVAIGKIAGKDFIPDHELAVSNLWNKNLPQIELSKTDAIKYLKREELIIASDTLGWALVTFEKLPLGWVKILPNRINNYYPKEWRVLK